jgi:subtilisin-like proprotein convertase family protein
MPALSAVTGDGDAFLEPGESAQLELPATNEGDGRAAGTRLSASTSDPQVTVTPASRSYGALRAGATRTRRFRIAVAPSHPLGKRVPLDVRVRFAGALSPTTSARVVRTARPAATPVEFAYAGEPVPIPDDDDAGATITIPVSGVGYADRLTFSIDGTACTSTAGETTVGLDHTFVGDLIGTLTAPGGQTATLMDRDGAGGNNLCQVTFDDAAAQPFASVTLRQAPFTGSWRAADPLDELLIGPVDGDWTFKVVDMAPRDVGTLRAASLRLTGFVP